MVQCLWLFVPVIIGPRAEASRASTSDSAEQRRRSERLWQVCQQETEWCLACALSLADDVVNGRAPQQPEAQSMSRPSTRAPSTDQMTWQEDSISNILWQSSPVHSISK